MERVEMRPATDLVRCPTCSGLVMKKRAKPEEEVAGGGAKEERTKKKRTKKVLSPKPEEKEMAADTGSEEDSKYMAKDWWTYSKPWWRYRMEMTALEKEDYDAFFRRLYRIYGYGSYDERVEMDLVRVRCPRCSGWVMRKLAKLEEEVAGDGAMGGVGITKHPKTKPKPKPKPDEDKEMVADAGAKEESTKKEKRTKKEKKMVADAGVKEERTKKKRTKRVLSPKPDEKEMAADTGSEEEDSKSMTQPAGCRKWGTKMVPRRLSKEFLEHMLNYPPPPPYRNLPVDDCDCFIRTMARERAAAEKDTHDFTAFVLDQYRSYGYAEIPVEVTDDEEEV